MKMHYNRVCVLLLIVGFVLPVVAEYNVDLTGNVPLYGQESCCWCGAASGQMIMDGYPDPADRVYHEQEDIWDAIQANNIDADWCTDPEGLRQTLIDMNPPPAGTWIVHADADRDEVMFDILYWMNRNNYSVATLINQGGHWVVIVGYETDVEPVSGSDPILNEIIINDPEPHDVGTQSTIDAAVWYDTDWDGPVQYAGTWEDQYVAVIEPPVVKGKVKVKQVVRTGEKIIRKEEAIKLAKKYIDELGLAKKTAYAILNKKGVTNLEPILVREETESKLKHKEKGVPYYYIVPFGFEYEIGKCNVRLTRVGVIINAFTGRFEEISAFGKPIRYLPREEAIGVVAKALKLNMKEMKNVKATMMFQPSEMTHIRLYPFWKVTVGEKILYVDQLGDLWGYIRPCNPGD